MDSFGNGGRPLLEPPPLQATHRRQPLRATVTRARLTLGLRSAAANRSLRAGRRTPSLLESSEVRVTVLGLSGGYPAPGFACSGYLVEAGDTRVWMDAGSGTLSRLLGQCSLADLTAVLISHLHADHWTDLPLALHTLRFAFEREAPLAVYGPSGWMAAMGIVAEWAREDDPVFVPHELRERETIEIGGLAVEPIGVVHSDLETFGFRISGEGRTLAYSADSAPCPPLDELAHDADLFICEALAPVDESEMHLSGREAGSIAARSGTRRLLVTHLVPGAKRDEVLAAASDAFGGRVELAVEGLSVEV